MSHIMPVAFLGTLGILGAESNVLLSSSKNLEMSMMRLIKNYQIMTVNYMNKQGFIGVDINGI